MSARTGVLAYLSRARPAKGIPLVIAGLKSARLPIRNLAVAAFHTYRRAGWEPDESARRVLSRLAEQEEHDVTRLLALHILRSLKDTPADTPSDKSAR